MFAIGQLEIDPRYIRCDTPGKKTSAVFLMENILLETTKAMYSL